MYFALRASVEEHLTLVGVCGQVQCTRETGENWQQTPTGQESRIYLLVCDMKKRSAPFPVGQLR